MMKKAILQLLALVFCVTISQYSYSQNRKYTKTDSFYFETPKTKNLPSAFPGKSIDSIRSSINTPRSLFNDEETNFSLNRSIQLSDNSGSKTISIDVNDNSLEFLLSVNCDLKSGVLTIEIYDPKGAKRGNFSVKGSRNNNDPSGWTEIVGGSINKRYSKPLKGSWSLKFIAEKVTADILIKTQIK